MKKFFRDILTGIDNQTFDLVKFGGLVSLLALLAIETVQIIITKAASFNAINFATAVGLILGAIGASVKIKETTEPQK